MNILLFFSHNYIRSQNEHVILHLYIILCHQFFWYFQNQQCSIRLLKIRYKNCNYEYIKLIQLVLSSQRVNFRTRREHFLLLYIVLQLKLLLLRAESAYESISLPILKAWLQIEFVLLWRTRNFEISATYNKTQL